MIAKVLVDTNILVYAYDRSDLQKQQKAFSILNQLVISNTGVLSTQVLAEFFVTITSEKKLSAPLSIAEAYQRLQNYLQTFTVVEVTAMVVLEAARGVRDYQFSFWDAQIWATARLNQISTIYSEDFNVNTVIEGIQFLNPFSDGLTI